jgi:hypothetical protein
MGIYTLSRVRVPKPSTAERRFGASLLPQTGTKLLSPSLPLTLVFRDRGGQTLEVRGLTAILRVNVLLGGCWFCVWGPVTESLKVRYTRTRIFLITILQILPQLFWVRSPEKKLAINLENKSAFGNLLDMFDKLRDALPRQLADWTHDVCCLVFSVVLEGTSYLSLACVGSSAHVRFQTVQVESAVFSSLINGWVKLTTGTMQAGLLHGGVLLFIQLVNAQG